MLITIPAVGLGSIAIATVQIGSIYNQDVPTKDRDDSEHLPDHHELDWKISLIMPVTSSIMLLLLFYFYSYFQYFMILLITISAYWSLSQILMKALSYFGFNKSRILANIFSLIIVEEWLRHGNFVAHNLLGCALCVITMNYLRFPSLKVACICLFGLLAYDVFWVFYSELIFKSNVMVKVASQASLNPIYVLGEVFNLHFLTKTFQKTLQLPIKLIMPNWEGNHFSMLGLGDIILPGMLVRLSFIFDQYFHQEKIDEERGKTMIPEKKKQLVFTYFKTAMTGYIIGLLTAFVMNSVTAHPQPALVYLVPAVTFSLSFLAFRRGQFLEVWTGPKEFSAKS